MPVPTPLIVSAIPAIRIEERRGNAAIKIEWPAIRQQVIAPSGCGADYGEPLAHLKDLLTRLPTQPASKVAELLPHRWRPEIVLR